MAFYECVLLARQDLTSAQVETLGDDVTAILGEGNGSVTKRENWGLRSLHFRINKNRKAHYLFFNIDAPAPAVHELERRLRLNEDVIRHMVVRADELEEGPSMMMQKSDRPERPGRRGDRPERSDRGPRPDRRPAREDSREEEGAV